jgi:hypothetical protein
LIPPWLRGSTIDRPYRFDDDFKDVTTEVLLYR